ncbi:MAG TPA: hypothetical protein VGT61_01280 [Thermomicrobiales bacterium]|nr:hypothetical protein [Thermomicrobiales bacterium]
MTEGNAVITRDEDLLQVLARRWTVKYPGWVYKVRDGTFSHDGGGWADVCRIGSTRVLGFAEGDVTGQMRWLSGGER